MRFPGAEVAGNPDPVVERVVEVVFEELVQAVCDVAGDDVFLDLGVEIPFVIGLDDALDVAVDILLKKVADEHMGGPLGVVGGKVDCPVVGAVERGSRYGAEEPELRAAAFLLHIFAREEHHDRMAHHGGLKGFQNGVGPEERKDAADGGDEGEPGVVIPDDFQNSWDEVGFGICVVLEGFE